MDDGLARVSDGGRPRWMSLLARAEPEHLEDVWQSLEPRPVFRFLRVPEVGLVMLRGRMGGTGAAFNVGEATVARCTVVLEEGLIGHAYVLGRDLRHVELAALFDALLQRSPFESALRVRLLDPITRCLQAERTEQTRRREATRVEFFTMVRGDD
ncbi:MAG: phosphonate C-P lyase system protein PhnG [Hyphomicrobiaceae bacterium]